MVQKLRLKNQDKERERYREYYQNNADREKA